MLPSLIIGSPVSSDFVIPHSWLLPVLLPFCFLPQWSLFTCDPPGAFCYFCTLIIHDTLIQSHSVLLPGPTYPVVIGCPVDTSSFMYLKIHYSFPKGILIILCLPTPISVSSSVCAFWVNAHTHNLCKNPHQKPGSPSSSASFLFSHTQATEKPSGSDSLVSCSLGSTEWCPSAVCLGSELPLCLTQHLHHLPAV